MYSTEQIDYTDDSHVVGDDEEEMDDPSHPEPCMKHQVPIWSLKKNMQKTLPGFVSKSRASNINFGSYKRKHP